MAFKPVKGTRDFYPEQMEPRSKVFDFLRKNAKQYGYKEVETPALEALSLLTAKSGDEVKDQIFVMEKRSSEEVGLRFDLTVPVTRMFVEKQKELPKPVKWFYLTRMWRYEAPQKGRLREFYQFGVELFGSEKIQADADVISLAIDNLISLGLTKDDIVVKINNRDLLEGFLESIGITDISSSLRGIDKKEKLSADDFRNELSFFSDEQFEQLTNFLSVTDLENLPSLSEKAKEAKNKLQQLFTLLTTQGKKEFIQFTPSIARGLGYYTGTVFECFDREGKFRALFGGGRYDNMVEQFGGQPCPATGFAMGDVVLELFLKEKGLWKDEPSGVDYYVAPVNAEYVPKALSIASKLRKNNTVEVDVMERKLGKQFTYANTIKARRVVVVGDETKDGKVKIKDMETGAEEEIEISLL